MINKEKIVNFIKGVFRPSDNLSSPRLMHPKREWFIGLLVAILLLIGTTVWSTYSYIHFRDFTPEKNNPDEENIVVYRESLVEQVLEDYQRREQTYENLINQISIPEDNQESMDVNTATSSSSSPSDSESTQPPAEVVGDTNLNPPANLSN